MCPFLEEKAKETEKEVRARARRAREEHRLSLKEAVTATMVVNALGKMSTEPKSHKKKPAPPVPQR